MRFEVQCLENFLSEKKARLVKVRVRLAFYATVSLAVFRVPRLAQWRTALARRFGPLPKT